MANVGDAVIILDPATGAMGSAVDAGLPITVPCGSTDGVQLKPGVVFGADFHLEAKYLEVGGVPVPNLTVQMRDTSGGGLRTHVSCTPNRWEYCAWAMTATVQAVRMDSAVGPQGQFQIQGANSSGAYFNSLQLVSYTSSVTAGAEQAYGQLFNREDGAAASVLYWAKGRFEIKGNRALWVNGSCGNAGDVLVSQGPNLPPKWMPPA